MRARWAGVDENMGAKMCWKLVDDVSGEIICRSTICFAIEPGTANLQVNPIEPNTEVKVESTENDELLDEFILLAGFETPFSRVHNKVPVASIPSSTKSKTWQDIEREEDHHEDTQQQYFQT